MNLRPGAGRPGQQTAPSLRPARGSAQALEGPFERSAAHAAGIYEGMGRASAPIAGKEGNYEEPFGTVISGG